MGFDYGNVSGIENVYTVDYGVMSGRFGVSDLVFGECEVLKEFGSENVSLELGIVYVVDVMGNGTYMYRKSLKLHNGGFYRVASGYFEVVDELLLREFFVDSPDGLPDGISRDCVCCVYTSGSSYEDLVLDKVECLVDSGDMVFVYERGGFDSWLV